MITSLWLALKTSRGAQIVLGVGLAIILGLVLYIWAIRQHNATVEHAVEQGRVEQRADGLQTTIERTKDANNAAEAVRTDPAVRDAQCLRYARNPDDC